MQKFIKLTSSTLLGLSLAATSVMANAQANAQSEEDPEQTEQAFYQRHPYYTAAGVAAGLMIGGLIVRNGRAQNWGDGRVQERVLKKEATAPVAENTTASFVRNENEFGPIVRSYRGADVTVMRIDPLNFGLPDSVGAIEIDGAVLKSPVGRNPVVVVNSLDYQSYQLLLESKNSKQVLAVLINETDHVIPRVSGPTAFEPGTLTADYADELDPTALITSAASITVVQ